MVTIDEFKNIDIRIGRIIEAKAHETARNPMFILRVDFGGEIGERTIIAGIRDRYTKEEIEGKKVACVVNLDPKRVANVESNGMILAAESNEVLALLVPDRDIDLGSKVH